MKAGASKHSGWCFSQYEGVDESGSHCGLQRLYAVAITAELLFGQTALRLPQAICIINAVFANGFGCKDSRRFALSATGKHINPLTSW